MQITLNDLLSSTYENADVMKLYIYIMCRAEEEKTNVIKSNYKELSSVLKLSNATIQKAIKYLKINEVFDIPSPTTFIVKKETEHKYNKRINLTETFAITYKDATLCHALLNNLIQSNNIDDIKATLTTPNVTDWLSKQTWFCLDWYLTHYDTIKKGKYIDIKQHKQTGMSFENYKEL